MMAILAIDPGTTQSAWVVLRGDVLESFAIDDNQGLRNVLRRNGQLAVSRVVIEDIEPRQQPLGREVADTLRWIGRFMEAAHPLPVHLLTRRAVTNHHVDGGTKNADSRIRLALIDRYGGPGAIRKGGALYGVSRDVWQALAVAVAFQDRQREAA